MPVALGEVVPELKTVTLKDVDFSSAPGTIYRGIWYADEDYRRRNRLGGLLLSAYASFHARVAPGPTIVLLALAGFVVAWPLGVWLRSRRRLRQPFPVVEAAVHDTIDDHPHEHGDDCGHVAVPHGDHVDYVHDGHRHAAHGRHYDEH